MTKRKPVAKMLEGWDGHDRHIGMRVQVLGGKTKKNMGLGTITKLDDGYPSEILLDDGRKTEGGWCWWYPIENKGDYDR